MSERVAAALRNVRIRRVALVDKGANLDRATGDGAHIMLFKRDDSKEPLPKEKSVAKNAFAKLLERVLKTGAMSDEAARAAEIDAIIKEAEAMSAPAAREGNDSEHGAHLEAMKAVHKKIGEQLAGMGAGPHPDGHPYHKLKTLHEGLGKMLSDAGCAEAAPAPGEVGKAAMNEELAKRDTQIADLTKRLNDQIEKGEVSEMSALLKSFKATPFDLEDDKDAKKFAKMKKSDPETYDRMMTLFKAADAQLSTSKLFKNVGSGQQGTGTAWDKLVAKTEERMSKNADANMTFEKMLDRVMLENPKLVEEYRAEQN